MYVYRSCSLFSYESHRYIATQYCDGLRGPLVIYDPNDPFADMYDVDDGMVPQPVGN